MKHLINIVPATPTSFGRIVIHPGAISRVFLFFPSFMDGQDGGYYHDDDPVHCFSFLSANIYKNRSKLSKTKVFYLFLIKCNIYSCFSVITILPVIRGSSNESLNSTYSSVSRSFIGFR